MPWLTWSAQASQYHHALARDHDLLAGRNDQDVDRACLMMDAFARPLVGGYVQSHAEPLQAFADLLPYGASVLADAAGENQAFQSAQRSRHGGDLLRHAEGEEIDCLG